jgi:uncharacterized BrkB/YihY/UPF0761 family membrane protein
MAIPHTEIVIELGWLYELFTTVIPVVFTFLLFYIIYRYISEKRLSRLTALLAAGIYTVLFEAARLGVSFYLEYAFTAYRHIYQGYTALIVFGLWIFYSAMLFIISLILARAWEETYRTTRPSVEVNPYTKIS